MGKNMLNRINSKESIGIFFILLSVVYSASVGAIEGPTEGEFGYRLYEVAVEEMLQGPIGFLAGLAGVVISASKLSSNWLVAILGILGSTAILSADEITTSLGYLV